MNATIIINLIIGFLGAGIGSGIMVLVQMWLQRKWQLEDRSSEKVDAQTEALKVLMIDRVRSLGRAYIAQGHVTLEDKETIKEMYDSYKGLGGNGHLKTLMNEVEKLEVKYVE